MEMNSFLDMVNRLISNDNTDIWEKAKRVIAYIKQQSGDFAEIDRPYLHYKATKLLTRPLLWYTLCVLSAILVIPKTCYLLVRGIWISRQPERSADCVLVGTYVPYDGLIPQELFTAYPDMQVVDNGEIGYITLNELRLFFRYWRRHPFSPKYAYNLISGYGLYTFILHRFHPKMIATYAKEDNCRISAMTAYCDMFHIRHANFMHGDILITENFCFMRVHDLYLWDHSYKFNYDRACVAADEYHVYRPEKFTDMPYSDDAVRKNRITYYMSLENIDNYQRMRDALKKLQALGYQVVLRFHPRFTNIALISNVFREFEIENSLEISMTQSLSETGIAIGTCSTSLLQAYYSGIEVVINDVSDPDVFRVMEMSGYWALKRGFKRLSELI